MRQIMMYADQAYLKTLGIKPENLISFAGGWVNHKAPLELQKAYKEIVSDDESMHASGGYSPTLGMLGCKEAIVKFEKHTYAVQNLEPCHIAIGASSTQLLSDLMRVLLDPDDKVLLLDPSYCNYQSQIVTATDANIIRFPVIDVDTWEYNADKRIGAFVDYIQKERPKAVLLVSPDNPTSQVLSQDFVVAAYEAVCSIGSFLVVDFAYKDMVFEEKIPEYFSWGPTDNLISIHSNSKWSRSLGRRLGWIEADESVIQALDSIQSSTILCPDTLHQMAFQRCVNEAVENNTLRPYIKKVSDDYKKAAFFTVAAIKKYTNAKFLVPQGGLFTCIDVSMDGAVFVEKALKETGVLLVPGWGFGKTLKNAVRLSFGPLVYDLQKIEEGIKRVSRLL
ncbi:MAG: Aminotransferase [Candidatus Magasanikbacteria bacterium GW2011_GWC2_45_8]|uniref:Aminotransferase n=1 Tax=Candidatus Magasanikbacteria bacterium GW2011_GWC2_45_8 TaxID=1619050 RepID=A0A0G1N0J8_9BACT|nr:MAG: Aminotransferase [Candidatus Magasanikbacteria bacterium GW2011_GWC2_45_8]